MFNLGSNLLELILQEVYSFIIFLLYNMNEFELLMPSVVKYFVFI